MPASSSARTGCGRAWRGRSMRRPKSTQASRSCGYYAYWSGVPTDGVEFYRRHGRVILVFPTHDEQTCVYVGWPCDETAAYRADVKARLSGDAGTGTRSGSPRGSGAARRRPSKGPTSCRTTIVAPGATVGRWRATPPIIAIPSPAWASATPSWARSCWPTLSIPRYAIGHAARSGAGRLPGGTASAHAAGVRLYAAVGGARRSGAAVGVLCRGCAKPGSAAADDECARRHDCRSGVLQSCNIARPDGWQPVVLPTGSQADRRDIEPLAISAPPARPGQHRRRAQRRNPLCRRRHGSRAADPRRNACASMRRRQRTSRA